MESLVISRIFRRLLSHETCSKLRCRPLLSSSRQLLAPHQRRTVFGLGREPAERKYGYGSGGRTAPANVPEWRPKKNIVNDDKTEEYRVYPMITADELRTRKQRPRRVKMLLREFIEDSLYNPNYGYFPKQAVIFSPGEAIDFHNIRDEPEFYKILGQRYKDFEDRLDEEEYNDSRQLWHTPTELFKPYYGEAMARYMVTNYKLSLYPYYDLLIYEMGAGNGTMMLNILDYIRREHPEVYQRTRFRIIEISSSLADLQSQQLKQTASTRGHRDRVEIINRSIFDWDQYVSSPCFFLALEVFDNFAHDAIRYDILTKEPLQATVLIDSNGEYYEFYEREPDPVVSRYLKIRDIAARSTFPHPLGSTPVTRALTSLKGYLPVMGAGMTEPEYIPTRLMEFFNILHNYFPAHRLLSSDFHHLPTSIGGLNAPLVQTRFERRTIPVTSPLVLQGFFDILFPTDFRVAEDVYRAITGKLTRVSSHEDFLGRWAFEGETRVRSGENPLVSWYKNASVMITV